MKTMKTYNDRAKDKEIINKILLYIVSDTNSEREVEYATMIEEATNGEILKEEFHDWVAEFDINDYIS